jgi:hypothetical protein
MPLIHTTHKGRPAYKWGSKGHPYTYTPGDPASRARAQRQALRQGSAIEISKSRSRKDRQR